MKRAFALVWAVLCLFCFIGCDPGVNRLDADELLQDTTKIELVQYENQNPKVIRSSKKNASVFHSGKATLLAELDPSRYEDVIQEITKNEYPDFQTTLNEPIGKTMILHQSDGTMVVLFSKVHTTKQGGTRYYGKCNVYDENGSFLACIGDIDSDYVDRLEETFFTDDAQGN